MFSKRQKEIIAQVIEDTILGFHHPEMPKENPNFKLHIDGKESWSWADIEPNWKYKEVPASINPFNEKQDSSA